MCKILLITPPFLQPNTPYPATAYLKGYLSRKGMEVRQADLSVEVLNDIFTRDFLTTLFDNFRSEDADDNVLRIYSLRKEYISTIDVVMRFLRGQDPTIAMQICSSDFLPQASRFDAVADLEDVFGAMGQQDCAKYLATLYLQDISDFIRATVAEEFEIVKYAESLSLSVPEYSKLQQVLDCPCNAIEQLMCNRLREMLVEYAPEFVGFSVPFPGNLLGALRCGRYIKTNFPDIKVIMGGGYPTTELRHMTDDGIFGCVDYVVLDDGELATERIVTGGELIHTYTAEGYYDNATRGISHEERGCPDFSDLPFEKYFSLCEITNPMHRLWSDGRWNKMILAHGCYWAKCAFCDTSLDYIGCFDSVSAEHFVDWMELVAAQTGSSGFHFVDEAASPKLLKEVSLEILRRGLKFSWWTNIRFEKAFTGDLCRLMAAAGCVAVSGGLETANDRLLKLINKGVNIEQATMTMRNFYYAGIMVHTYLMYGFPTETLQDTIDSLEVVRQMFRARLIDSAFWHRYAMTLYSHSGIAPHEYGVRRKGMLLNPFANNEVAFSENRGYSLDMVGEALRLSLVNYMAGVGLEKPVNKWFEGKVPHTTIENSLITDALIKPDDCRIFSPTARLVWLGGDVLLTEKGLLAMTKSEEKEIKFKECDAEFLMEIIEKCADLENDVRFDDVKEYYAQFSEEPFLVLYHSKQWDMLRKMGLLQI